MFSWGKKKTRKDKERNRDRSDSEVSSGSKHSPKSGSATHLPKPTRGKDSPKPTRAKDSPKPVRAREPQSDRSSEVGSRSTSTSTPPPPSDVAVGGGASDVKSHTLERNKSTYDVDVMISYSHQNRPCLRKLQEALRRRNLTVWIDEIGQKAGMDFLNKIGQAIIDSKTFVCLLSTDYVQSKPCQDELALAQVYNKPIFPCALNPADELFPKMDAGMKLQLARSQWTILDNDAKFDKKMDVLAKGLSDVIARLGGTAPSRGDVPAAGETGKQTAVDPRSSPSSTDKSNYFSSYLSASTDETTTDFWGKYFADKQSVSWPEFYKEFIEEYREQLTTLFDAKEREWLINIVMRTLDVRDPVMSVVSRQAFDEFCLVRGRAVPFFERVQDEAVETYAMKEVFSMESCVRIEAIENLGKFRSAAVVRALLNLLQEGDNNARAVAAISLARSGEASDKIVNALLKTLSDKDRLVRESGCLALGHLKAKRAVPQILNLWRNDFISHVREAAQVALEQIGGEEAENAIHITKVLSDEIRILVQEQNTVSKPNPDRTTNL